MNVIFGSGIVGLLAKFILGSSWTVVPFAKSRFFSFNPALDDNFIIRDKEIDPLVKELAGGIDPPIHVYRRAWSISGELLPIWDAGLCSDWLFKIFGTKIPTHSEAYLKERMNLWVYDLRVNEVYNSLVHKFMPELKEEAAKGEVTEVGDHYFIRGGVRQDFDNAVSTIPLNVLYRLLGSDLILPSKNMHYLHVKTQSLDFEGMNQTLVVDQLFDFFKVTNVAPERYLFYCHNDMPDPGAYLMSIMPKFDILDGTSIRDAIPMGPIPKLDGVDKYGVHCVGSYAQWDWCMDVGSCMLRILRYSNRGLKPGGLRKIL
jgi:hypothetical protein